VRLRVYPDLYYLVSSFIKKKMTNPLGWEELEQLLAGMNELDSKNGIYFTKASADACSEFRKCLRKLLESKNSPSTPPSLDDLEEKARDTETALKHDIYIYGIDLTDYEPKVAGEEMKKKNGGGAAQLKID